MTSPRTWPAAYPVGKKRFRGCIQRAGRTTWNCPHQHKSDDAAQACAAKKLKR